MRRARDGVPRGRQRKLGWGGRGREARAYKPGIRKTYWVDTKGRQLGSRMVVHTWAVRS